jgi:glycosyltransferase involved in cell wall biosynthesis
MNKIVSLVIKAYNKCELFQFGIASLKNQSYDMEKFEVVLVDDGSTDKLIPMITRHSLPFQFKLVIFPRNMGRAAAWNGGIKAAEGDIVILADADCVFPKEFIANHVKYHNRERVVVSGAANYFPLYTYMYPEFTIKQKEKALRVIKSDDIIRNRVLSILEQNKNLAGFPIATLEDIAQANFAKYCVREWPGLFKHICEEYGENLANFHGKWMAFIGLYSISVRRKHLLEIGMIDESFYEYGLEDWELGYRFYKEGYDFLCPHDVYDYHQEHPRNQRKVLEGNIINYDIFRKKHPDMQIKLFSLSLGDWSNWDTDNLGRLYTEVEGLNKIYHTHVKPVLELLDQLSIWYGDLLINNIETIKVGSELYSRLNDFIHTKWDRRQYQYWAAIARRFIDGIFGSNNPYTSRALELLLCLR